MDKYKDLKELINKRSIKGVVFDFDGTIVNLFVNWSELKWQLKNKFLINQDTNLNNILIGINNKYGPSGLEDAYNLIQIYELKDLEKAIVNKNILEIIKECHEKNIKLGVFSSNMKRTVDYLLDKLKIKDLFDIIITKEDVKLYKPEPEGLQLIINRWKINKSDALFVGNDNLDKLCGMNIGVETFTIENIKRPLVSIILFTYNAEKYIKNNLKSICSQKFQDFEILVVDKFSNDRTVEIAKEFDKVKILSAPIERSTQVNYGVKHSLGKYIFITGVDIEYQPDYLIKAVEKCEMEGYDAIYTSVVTKNDSYFGKCKALERLCYVGDDLHESARFVKKDVFLKLGGYDENLVAGEDYDFQRKLNENGYKTGRVDVIAEYHLGEEESIDHIIKRSFYYGKTLFAYFKKHKRSGFKQMSPIRRSYFKHWQVWLKDPIHTLGFIFYKLLQYTFGGLGLIYAIIINYRVKE
jgi:glycosyltransferase involved in cell wall biosynthesis/phosphoglycolate phosphatase-like HAD superfamily hydrolase